MNKFSSLASVTLTAVSAAAVNAAPAVSQSVDLAGVSVDLAGVMDAVNLYLEGGRVGDSRITRQAFMPAATMSWCEGGRRKTVPIQALYDYVDNAGAMSVGISEVKVAAATPTTAVLSAETSFGKNLYTDMFALVRDGAKWKIAAKVYHVKDGPLPFDQSRIDRSGILRAVERYLESGRQCSAEIGMEAFAPEATMTWEVDGKLNAVPIGSLYEAAKARGKQKVEARLAGLVATEDTAIASIEADFSVAGRFTDSFALVKDGDSWKIVAKVYHAVN